MIDLVDAGKLRDCGCRIDRFQHVYGETGFVELERRSPVLERNQTIDMLVMPFLVEGTVDGKAPELQHVEAGWRRRGQRSEDPRRGLRQRRVGLVRTISRVDGD